MTCLLLCCHSSRLNMFRVYIFVILSVIFASINQINACKGCVQLDDSSFVKILPHFEATLIKFDVAFPYGDKHDIFSKLATEVAENKDLLLGEIGVKDYGEKENDELAQKYGVTKDDFPAVKLFKKGVETPINFPAETLFTLDNLRDFIRDNSRIYLGLPGCVEAFDKLAMKFIDSNDKKAILKDTELLLKGLKEKEQNAAKIYTVIMKKVIDNGGTFITQENDRVAKLLKGKISAKKTVELQNRLNILRAFAFPRKDEL